MANLTTGRHSEDAQRLVGNKHAALEAQANTCAGVSRLPDDILIEVFLELKDNGDLFSWYHITHVCRRWRCVALGVANLWTYPPTEPEHHGFTLAMLERSRTRPLEITLSRRTTIGTYIAIVAHIGRVRSLTMDQPKEVLDHLQHVLLVSKHGAPNLTTLEIRQSDIYMEVWFRLSASTLRQLPSLKTLRVSNIDFDWNILRIRGLTSLCLFSENLSSHISWTQFRQALTEMHCLESLAIGLASLKLTPPSSPLEPLELSLLRKLKLCDYHPLATNTFLSTFSFPQLSDAHIEWLFGPSSGISEYSITIATVLSLITKGNFDRLNDLSIYYYVFTMSSKSSRGSSATDECTGMRFASFNNNWPNVDKYGPVRALMTRLALAPGDLASEVTHLSLHEELTSQSILELFGHLPQLESIWIKSTDPRQMIESLRISPLHPPGSPIPFSKLRSLEFDQSYRVDEHTPELLEELSSCLKQRRRHGAALSNLVVNWNLAAEELQCLQNIVSGENEAQTETETETQTQTTPYVARRRTSKWWRLCC